MIVDGRPCKGSKKSGTRKSRAHVPNNPASVPWVPAGGLGGEPSHGSDKAAAASLAPGTKLRIVS